jgi:hypothetical protein
MSRTISGPPIDNSPCGGRWWSGMRLPIAVCCEFIRAIFTGYTSVAEPAEQTRTAA